jgi:hypothetical protein
MQDVTDLNKVVRLSIWFMKKGIKKNFPSHKYIVDIVGLAPKAAALFETEHCGL